MKIDYNKLVKALLPVYLNEPNKQAPFTFSLDKEVDSNSFVITIFDSQCDEAICVYLESNERQVTLIHNQSFYDELLLNNRYLFSKEA